MSEIYKRYIPEQQTPKPPQANQHNNQPYKGATVNQQIQQPQKAVSANQHMRQQQKPPVNRADKNQYSHYAKSPPPQQKEHSVQELHKKPQQPQSPVAPQSDIQKKPACQSPFKDTSSKSSNILLNFLPKSLYNPETKKILGILSAEDLLIVALIFLFCEDSDDDNPILLLALLYLLFSEHIDLGMFSL